MSDGNYAIVSVDSHIIEPHDLWQQRVAARHREAAPMLRRDAESDRIVLGSEILTSVGFLAGVARPTDEARAEGRWDEDVFRGGYDPEARSKDLEVDGVDAEVLFPTIGMMLFPIPDPELRWALFRAYNDWLAEEFCAYAPDVFKGLAMIDGDDIDVAIAEVVRAKELGHVGVMLPLDLGGKKSYKDTRFDPLWAAAVETGLPVNLHSQTTRESDTDWEQRTLTDNILNTTQIQRALLDMILSGVFDRFPELMIVSAENDAGWAAPMLERADYYWRSVRSLVKLMKDGGELCAEEPSAYFHRNVRVTFMRDRAGVLARELIGDNTMMWGNDFPHHVSTWPNSKQVLDEHFYDQPADVRERIVCTNARELYGF